MKKNEVILTKDNSKLIFAEESQTSGKRKANEAGEFEFENGTGSKPYANKKDPELGKYVGDREPGIKTNNFTGDMRHLFLCVNVRHANRNEKYPAIPKDYAALHPITKHFASVWGTDNIYAKVSDLTPEFIAQVQGLDIPADWKAFCSETSKTAKKVFGTPAKSPKGQILVVRPTEPAKSKDLPNEKITNMAELLFAKYSTWAEIPEASTAKILDNCKKLGVKIAEVRRAYNTLAVPEPEQQEEQLDLEF